jgi:hypothetical protein
MTKDRLGIALIGVLVGALLVGLAPLGAQRPADPRPVEGAVKRYQIVRVAGSEIILLDTATGDLYAAGPNDVKPHASRPRVADGRPFTAPTPTTKPVGKTETKPFPPDG